MGKAGRRSNATANTPASTSDDDEEKAVPRTREPKGRKAGSSSSKSKSGGSSKSKKTSAFNQIVIGTSKLVPTIGSELIAFAADFKSSPAKAAKRAGKKICLYVWVIIVILALLSLMGFNVTGSSDGAAGSGALVSSTFGLFGSGGPSDVPELDGDSEEKKAPEESSEEIPEMVGYEAKKGNKINKAKEKQLACKEVDCNMSCLKKMNPKCAAKKTCRADREKICKRRCLKDRCEERCKDEPKYGYVEREQKMEKCKEGCQGSTAQHNKCIKKCHSEFKPCKSRCHEISVKFQCDSKKLDLESLIPTPSEDDAPKKGLKGGEEEEEEEPESGGDEQPSGSGEELDDEVI